MLGAGLSHQQHRGGDACRPGDQRDCKWKDGDFITQLGLLLFTNGEGRETARAGEDQLDRLQQEEDARGYFESGHADLQELQKPRTADREDDENSAAYGNRLKRQPRSHSATGCRRQDSEDGCGFERADRNQKHHDRRSSKFDDLRHFL